MQSRSAQRQMPRTPQNAVLALLLSCVLAGTASAASFPLAAYPLLTQSPDVAAYAPYTALNAADVNHWGGFTRTFTAAVRVDGTPYTLMGSPSRMGAAYKPAQQVSVAVTATRTDYSFTAGGVAVNVSFCTPALLTDITLLSPAATYVTLTAAASDGGSHAVQVLFTSSGEMVGGTQNLPVVWYSVNNYSYLHPDRQLTAMRIGAYDQEMAVRTPGGDNRAETWGWACTVADTTDGNVSTVQNGYGPLHASFAATGGLPSRGIITPGGAPNQGNSGQPDLSFPSSAVAWDITVTGATPSAAMRLYWFVDEVVSLDYFGTPLIPYWRRSLPAYSDLNWPWDSFAQLHAAADSAIAAATAFDAQLQRLLAPVADAAGAYAAMVSAIYRQVVSQSVLVYHPVREEAWHVMREGAGPIATVDVQFPASPLFIVLAPQLLQEQMLPILAYCANQTGVVYDVPYAAHDLGIWPVANNTPTGQETMPIEESANMLLMLAATTTRLGGDVEWLTPFWPALSSWAGYLTAALPFPGTQLTTDDFAGAMANSSNLALKGILGIAAYGILLQQSGDDAGAAAAWATAGEYAAVWEQFAWYDNVTSNGVDYSHVTREYAGNEPGATSWCIPYNAVFLRALGMDGLLPRQDYILNQTVSYLMTNQWHTYGVPLMSTVSGVKTDWLSFLAAMSLPPTPGSPHPVADSIFAAIMAAVAAQAASTDPANHLPFSDYYDADNASVHFYGRAVMGAALAPVMVAQMDTAKAAADAGATGADAYAGGMYLRHIAPARAAFAVGHARAAQRV